MRKTMERVCPAYSTSVDGIKACGIVNEEVGDGEIAVYCRNVHGYFECAHYKKRFDESLAPEKQGPPLGVGMTSWVTEICNRALKNMG